MKRLRDIRKQQGLTIDHVADRAKISRGFLSQLENGKRQPSLETIQQLAAALNVSPRDLMETDSREAEMIEIAKKLEKLSDEDLAAIERMIEALSKN